MQYVHAISMPSLEEQSVNSITQTMHPLNEAKQCEPATTLEQAISENLLYKTLKNFNLIPRFHWKKP